MKIKLLPFFAFFVVAALFARDPEFAPAPGDFRVMVSDRFAPKTFHKAVKYTVK